MGLFSKSNGSSGGEQMYEVKIKGTIQMNGPKNIRETIVVDRQQMQAFTGSKRYEAIEGWLKVNYPGATIPNIRSFAAEAKPIKK